MNSTFYPDAVRQFYDLIEQVPRPWQHEIAAMHDRGEMTPENIGSYITLMDLFLRACVALANACNRGMPSEQACDLLCKISAWGITRAQLEEYVAQFEAYTTERAEV